MTTGLGSQLPPAPRQGEEADTRSSQDQRRKAKKTKITIKKKKSLSSRLRPILTTDAERCRSSRFVTNQLPGRISRKPLRKDDLEISK